MTGRTFLPRMGLMLGGLMAWAAQFAVLYGVAALTCADRVPLRPGSLATVSLAASGSALLVAGLASAAAVRTLRRAPDEADGFVARMTLLTSGLAAVAIVWTGLPPVVIPICPPG